MTCARRCLHNKQQLAQHAQQRCRRALHFCLAALRLRVLRKVRWASPLLDLPRLCGLCTHETYLGAPPARLSRVLLLQSMRSLVQCQ